VRTGHDNVAVEAAVFDFPETAKFASKSLDIGGRLDTVKVDAFKKIFVCSCHERRKSDGRRYQQGDTATSSGGALDHHCLAVACWTTQNNNSVFESKDDLNCSQLPLLGSVAFQSVFHHFF
jgi:hypothetical protein